MKKLTLLTSLLFVLATMAFANTNKTDDQQHKGTRIQVAILLDTSSSMDGLIEQAKSRLWNIVNTLTTLRYKGEIPQIEIALYEYGNDRLKERDSYIRQVAPLTTNLDLISEKLFSLTTYGGLEYCGAVIDQAVSKLEWGNHSADMKLIYIAGNEPFTQGRVSYKSAIDRALDKDIYVHTIHCGDRESGIRGMWRDGAIRGKGRFFNIDHNAKIRYYDTPYDDRISRCNERLNSTYVGYGSDRYYFQSNQVAQDANALKMSKSNMAERAVSKSAAAYDNSSWDLVDMAKKDKTVFSRIKKSELPGEYQDKSTAEIEKLVKEKEAERATIQKEINDLARKRQEYIDEQKMKEGGDTSADDLGKAINESILALANQKGYTNNSNQ
ncbi:hypothetical protein GGR21_000596 [Dysgonomonas hofstadii]|uniref:VWFA domain-containing protein n=1 Tax=Dysgonomonas hofstadii TaxID=637886 RepID=A0A840CJ63_9BACT|nr:vWA domain-containing protein [Dysgonomonas hofstadii]MBB4034709.1 hypothetical protein [Dysgonomonas hofstadii]